MATHVRPIRTAVLGLSMLVGLGVPPVDDSGTVTSGPIVTSSRPEVEPGASTVLTIDGFTSPYVQISICGNEGRRGSADCNMSASEGVEVNGDEPLVLQMPVAAPPVDCPCVIRVVGKDSSEVAITPIVVIGHPVGPLVDPPVLGDLVAVSITAREAPKGALDALRSDLGGKINFEVTVRVKNLANTPLKQVSVSASAGRSASDDSLVSLELENPGLLGVGQTWQQTVTVEIPAPAFGSTEWRATVSGAGRIVTTTSTTKHRPWLLIILSMVVVLNIGLLLIRWRIRRRSSREAAAAAIAIDANGANEAMTSGGDPAAVVAVEDTREFVSAST
ncbi:MAG: hypothetical protein AAB131_06500 [Actinomycetota bacterium]